MDFQKRNNKDWVWKATAENENLKCSLLLIKEMEIGDSLEKPMESVLLFLHSLLMLWLYIKIIFNKL